MDIGGPYLKGIIMDIEHTYPHVGEPERNIIEGIIMFAQINTGCLDCSKNIPWHEDFVNIRLTPQIYGTIYNNPVGKWTKDVEVNGTPTSDSESFFDGSIYGVFT